MEVAEVLLLVSLVALSFFTILLTSLSISYIKSKPFASQSTYDLLYCDLFALGAATICVLDFIIGCGLLFR